ncbi:MAG: hypothetical protein LBU13_09750 [Synergistaceae bacterium]|jgi:hypothetical protein|nr:hypothetical protein [Synergistaceae bacterium]
MEGVGYVIGVIIAVVIVALVVLSKIGPFIWRTHEKDGQRKPRSYDELFGENSDKAEQNPNRR